MKYLKYYKDSKRNDKLYKQIEKSDFDSIVKNRNLYKEDFTQLEIEQIRNLGNIKRIHNRGVRKFLYTMSIEFSNFKQVLSINKYNDEWYIIYVFSTEFYLCDGMEGLLDCLKTFIETKGRIVESTTNNKESYYKEINLNEYKNKIKNLKIESFTKNEIKSIKKSSLDLYNFKFVLPTSLYFLIDVFDSYNGRLLVIVKYSDEWYFINNCISNKIIMCDSFKGVEEYISNTFFKYYTTTKLYPAYF